MSRGGISNFGGDWSEQKLSALQRYLTSYTTALRKTSFKLAYIDAFAGAGTRKISEGKNDPDAEWFDELTQEEDLKYRHGSPLIALEIDPPFDAFIFIERDADSIAALQSQIEERHGSSKTVKYLQGDANEQLQELGRNNWTAHRAVAFLDPFALQVQWSTLETLAKTEAIDMWLLFPAMAVNRMLPRNGEIPEAWAARLDDLFGEEDWREAFYPKQEPNLFGEEPVSKVGQVFETLSHYVTQRLGSIFAKTHDKPLILKNRSGAPLFLLCFASANPKGAPIATRIASHIINTSSHGK